MTISYPSCSLLRCGQQAVTALRFTNSEPGVWNLQAFGLCPKHAQVYAWEFLLRNDALPLDNLLRMAYP